MALKSFNSGSNTLSNSNMFPVFAFSVAMNVIKNDGQFICTTYP